jgi:ABC-2 type transport system ATP-binding protein
MIEVRDLWKSYGGFHALLGINFTVNRGEIVGFCGPNGAGKTTCMKIMTGYMLPSRGSVTVGGIDVVEHSLEVRRMIGYLPENTPLYPDMTVREYLRYCADLRRMPGRRAADRINDVVDLCSLQPKFRAPIKTLSKGYKQRVGIAQALLHEPKVLILDEPTVGLDPNQVIPVRQIVRDVGRDRTVILCSHILSEVEAVCGRVVIIHEGVIVGDGTVDALKAGVGPGAGLEQVFRSLTAKAGVA